MFRTAWIAMALTSLTLATGDPSMAGAADANDGIACGPDQSNATDDPAGIGNLRREARCFAVDRLRQDLAKRAGADEQARVIALQIVDDFKKQLRDGLPAPAVYEKLARDMRAAAAGAPDGPKKRLLEAASLILHEEGGELQQQEAAALEAAKAGGELNAAGLGGTILRREGATADKRCPPLMPSELADLARPDVDPHKLLAEGRRQEACDPDFAARLYRMAAEHGLAEAQRALDDLDRSRHRTP